MSIGTNVGTAHITVRPSLRGWSSNMRRELRRELGSDGGALDEAVNGRRGGAGAAGQRSGREYAGGFDRTVRTAIARTLDRLPPIQIGAATGEAEQKMRDLRVQLETLRGQRIGIDVDAGAALAQVATIRDDLQRLALESPDINVQADTLLAASQLTALERQVDQLSRERAEIQTDADTAGATVKLTALRRLAERLGRIRVRISIDTSSTNVLDGMSRRTRTLLGLFALLGPALLPLGAVLLSLAASFTAAFTAAAAGVGLVLAAVLGNILPVIKAQQELEQKQDAAAAAGQAYAAAQQQVASASQGVADAERSAARAVADAARALADARRSAAEQVAAAEDAVRDAQDRARDAQEALNDARDDARERLAAYRDQLRGAALDESGAALSVTAAREALNAALSDPTSSQLDIDSARQALAEAEFAYDQAGKRSKDLKKQAARDRAAGVSGDDAVIDARERLEEANADVADSEAALGRARADAARQVADAERNLAQARADGARSVAAAEDQLAQAQAAAATAGAANAKAQAELRETMSKLQGPAAIFVAALERAKAAWRDFVSATAEDSFGLAAQGLDMFTDLLPALVPLARGAARAVGILLEDLRKFGEGPEGQAFLAWLERRAPRAIVSIGRSIGNLVKGLGYLVGAVADSDTGFLDMTRRFVKWSRALDTNPGMRKFIAYARRMAPLVGQALGAIAGALVAIATAAAPIGTVVLRILTAVGNWISGLDPDILFAVAAGFAAATAALFAFNIVAAINPFTLIAIALAAVVAGVILAYKNLEGFRDFVQTAFATIKAVAIDLWRNGIRPAFREIAAVAQDLWKRNLRPAFRDIGRLISNAWSKVIRPALRALWAYINNVLIPVIRFLWRNVVKPYIGLISRAIDFAWGKVIKPAFLAWWGYMQNVLIPTIRFLWKKVIKPAFDAIGSIMSGAWNDVIKPVFKAMRDFVRDILVPAIETGFGKIGDVFSALKKAAADPVKFVVDTVWNKGMRKVIDAIPGVDDPGGPDTSSWGKYALGGPVTGGVRGRDSVMAMMMPGEHVLTTDEVRKAGGHGNIFRLRQLLRSGRASELGGLAPLRSGRPARQIADLPAFAEGGTLTDEQVRRGLEFAASQRGDPYVWGGVGPNGFDCSGMMSAVTNAIRGATNVFSRLGSTASFPWAGFKPGYGEFTIGSTPNYGGSGVGHMAGTLRGYNIESRGGDGVVTGAGARGASDPGFTTRYHLGASGNFGGAKGSVSAAEALRIKFAAALKAIATFVKDAPGWAKKVSAMGPMGKLVRKGLHGIGGSLASWVNGKVPGPGSPMRNVFDAGGLARGAGLMHKATIRPERVLSPAQTVLFERQVATLEGFDAGMRRLDHLAATAERANFDLLVKRFRIDDWRTGMAHMEVVATDAATEVYAEQDGHSRRMSAMSYTGAGS